MQVKEYEDEAVSSDILAKFQDERKGIHLSDLDLCLKKAYYRRLHPQPITLDQAIMYIVGLSVQEYLYPNAETTYIVDGVSCSPDAPGLEMKSTRAAMKNFDPCKPHWLMRMMGYCKVTGVLDWKLSVIFVIPAKMRSWHFYFNEAEIEDNWNEVLQRKAILEKAWEEGKPPSPDFHEQWECGKCELSGFCLNGMSS